MFTSGHGTPNGVAGSGRLPHSLDLTAAWTPAGPTFISDSLLKLHYPDYPFIMSAVPDPIMSHHHHHHHQHQIHHHQLSGGCGGGGGGGGSGSGSSNTGGGGSGAAMNNIENNTATTSSIATNSSSSSSSSSVPHHLSQPPPPSSSSSSQQQTSQQSQQSTTQQQSNQQQQSHQQSQQQQQQGTSQKDTTFTKIFVGGLPYHTTDKSLRKFFEAFGEIEEAVVITDRQTGKSRGYGFVTMADRDDAERAVKDANPIIDGRKANVNLAYLGAKPRNNTQNGLPFPIRAGYPTVIPPGQFGLPAHHYVYHPAAASPYIHGAPGLILPSPAAPLTPTHFFDYPPAAYPPPPPPHPYTNGFESAAAFSPFQPHPSASLSNAAAVAAAVGAVSTNSSVTTGAGHGATGGSHQHYTAYTAGLAATHNGATSYLSGPLPTASNTTVTYVSTGGDARI